MFRLQTLVLSETFLPCNILLRPLGLYVFLAMEIDEQKKGYLMLSRGAGVRLRTSFSPPSFSRHHLPSSTSCFLQCQKHKWWAHRGCSLEETSLARLSTLQELRQDVTSEEHHLERGRNVSFPLLSLSPQVTAGTNRLPFLSVASGKLAKTPQAQRCVDTFLVCLHKSTPLHTANNFLKNFHCENTLFEKSSP